MTNIYDTPYREDIQLNDKVTVEVPVHVVISMYAEHGEEGCPGVAHHYVMQQLMRTILHPEVIREQDRQQKAAAAEQEAQRAQAEAMNAKMAAMMLGDGHGGDSGFGFFQLPEPPQ